MYVDTIDPSCDREDVEILLDGSPVKLPPGRRSLNGIQSYLETLALERQRVLCHLTIDGLPTNLCRPAMSKRNFARVEARTFELDDMPLQLIRTALEQTAHAQSEVHNAISLVQIQEGRVAREFWWNLARQLKQPLLTLTLMPEKLCGYSYGVSPTQLRKWQLQQLGMIMKDIDEACWADEPRVLANALESRVLRWLESLQTSLELWLETLLSAPRAMV
jgi:DNA-binding transcriptional MerR regulator